MFRLDLAERLGRTLAELDTSLGAWELQLWAARNQIEQAIRARLERTKGLTYAQALELARADHRATMERKGKTWP